MNIPYHSFAVSDDVGMGGFHIHRVFRNTNGNLATRQWWEHGAHGGEMRSMKPVDWEFPLPEGANTFFGSACGAPSDFINMFWAAWPDAKGVNALAIMQENAILGSLIGGDIPVHKAILGMDRKLRFFFWRKEGGGYALFRHVFTGELHQPGEVVTEKLIVVPYEPLLTVAEPCPTPVGDSPTPPDYGDAALAWLSKQGADMKAHTLWVGGKDVVLTDSDPIYGYQPFAKQRLGLWAEPPGILRAGWVMVRPDLDAARVGELAHEPKTGTKSHILRAEALGAASKLHSAATLLRKSGGRGATCYALASDGNLFRQIDSRVDLIRGGVPLSYDFPIFRSMSATYEAHVNDKGEVDFDHL